MKPFNETDTRHQIAHRFSQWTALSALRSGSPIKSRNDIYPLIEINRFTYVLNSDKLISDNQFNMWHAVAVKDIVAESNRNLPIGWAAKLLNVYLKSMVYLSEIGRPELVRHIHPPIDGSLWLGLKGTYKKDLLIWGKVYSKTTIKGISLYPEYQIIISGLRDIALKEKCLLIEVEQFWQGTAYKVKGG